MSAKATKWRVSVVAPRKTDGTNWVLLLRAPSWHGLGPKRESSGTPDKREAHRRAEIRSRELNAADGSVAEHALAADPTFTDVYESFVAAQERKATTDGQKNTAKSYASLRRHLVAAFEGVKDSSLSRAEILKARERLQAVEWQPGKKLAPSTVNAAMKYASLAWSWARERGHVSSAWERPRRQLKAKTEKRPFRPHEQRAVLEWLQGYDGGRWYAFFEFRAHTGLRIGDQLRLRWSQLERLPGGDVLVHYEDRKKSETATTSLPGWVVDLIPRVGSWVFPQRKDPAHHSSENGPRKAQAKALRAVGITDPEKLDLHSWRRTVRRDAAAAGLSLRESMTLLNHDSVATHEHYQAQADQDVVASARKLAAYRESQGLGRASQNPPRVSATGAKTARVKLSAVGALESGRLTTRHPLQPVPLGGLGGDALPLVIHPSPFPPKGFGFGGFDGSPTEPPATSHLELLTHQPLFTSSLS